MKRRVFIGLIVLAVLLLALGGLTVRSVGAAARSLALRRTKPAVSSVGARA